MRFNLPRMCALVLVALCCATRVYGADPQPYKVDLAPTGNSALDATLHATSDLIALRTSAPVSPFGLIARARSDIDRLKTVLESYGYYQSKVTIQINGMGLSDLTLADALVALPKNKEARVTAAFEPGPLYHLRNIAIDGELPQSAQGVLSLQPGAPAVAANVLAAGARLLSVLQDQGYAFAKVDPPVAYEDAMAPVLDVSFHVEAGARVRIGDIHLEGLQRMREKLVRRRLTLRTGEQYSSSAIERARQDLLGLNVFASINVHVGTAVDGSGGVPITFQFHERPRHLVTINAAYSSDLGGSGGVTWGDRNVLGNAEQLNIGASVTNVGGSATTGLGYDTTAKFIMPDFGHRDQSLQLAVGAVKLFLQAYDQTALTSSVTLTRRLSKSWTVSAAVSTTEEHILQNQPYFCPTDEIGVLGSCAPPGVIVQNPVSHDYTLVALPMSVSYDSTNLRSPLDDPTHGMRDSLSVAPTRSFGQTSATFLVTQVKFATYFDLERLIGTDAGRSVLAARVLAGLAQGAGELSLPPDQRFYGGGSGTIRGYRYQAVGPQFADGTPIGGTAITAGSLELRQRIGMDWGAAAFVDGGQVSASLRPLASSFYVGVGAGLRYYTPIGPIRLDIAVPAKHYPNPDTFEVYIGLGQAF